MYEKFVELLQINKVTPYQVSKATGVTQGSLSDWKRGRCTPKFSTLKKIADYFNVPVDYFSNDYVKKEADSSLGISDVYLSFAKEAQDSGINPEDIKLALKTIREIRGED